MTRSEISPGEGLTRRNFLARGARGSAGVAAAIVLAEFSILGEGDTEKGGGTGESKKEILKHFRAHKRLKRAYKIAQEATGVPWAVLAGIHYRECSADPNGNLQDGGGLGGSLAGSAIEAGVHLKSKVGGDMPKNFKELVKAVCNYNGSGNRNTDMHADFYGDNSPYALNKWDRTHSGMNLIYCSDGKKCPPGTPDNRPGALTVAKWLDPKLFESGKYKA